MNRSRTLFFLASSLLVVFIVAGSMLGAVSKDDGQDSLYKYLSVFTEVFRLVQDAYVENVDVHTLMAGALDGTTEAMDPFSLFLPADQVDSYLAARAQGSRLTGITLLKERGIAFVAAVDPGSPAEKAGVEVSDIVSEINGSSTRLMPVWEIQEILGGEPGSHVELELLRMGERETASFELAPFEPPAAGLDSVEGAGRIRVGSFQPENVARVRQALEEAFTKGERRLLVDLRGVAAGDARVAYDIAGFFVRGELGTLERRGEVEETFASEAQPVWQGKLVVLVNRGTLGPAEILATVLRQKAEAELVGERTFGWAGRQDIAELASGGRLVYTEAFYTGPDREALREGLEPDVRVSGVSRTFEEKDLPLSELILKRGVRQLLGDPEEGAARKAA